MRGTTIIAVRHNGSVAMGGDGQVSIGNTIMKHSANKVRRMYGDKVIGGFAGATADAFSLFARFEEKLEKFQGNLPRSAVELAKDWRTDKLLRRLEAMLIVADKDHSFLISGMEMLSKQMTVYLLSVPVVCLLNQLQKPCSNTLNSMLEKLLKNLWISPSQSAFLQTQILL